MILDDKLPKDYNYLLSFELEYLNFIIFKGLFLK
jgi:hypothetical protein